MNKTGAITKDIANRKRRKAYSKSFENTKEKLIEVKNIDYTILITVILLVLIGIVMVFSSSYYISNSNASKFHLMRMQSLVAIIGFLAMLLMSNINYRYLKRFINIFYWVSIFLLLLVPFIGIEVNGAKRWIEIPGIGIRFQPSEFAKIATILLIAQIISTKKNILNTFGGTVYTSFFVILSTVIIGIENLSTAIIVFIIGFSIIFVASPYTLVFIGMGVSAIVFMITYLAFFASGFRGARFNAWLDPFSDPTQFGYQTIQSLYAIGSGGMFGLGLGQSRQKLGFIPEAHNDIIFSIIAEELGLVGVALVLFLFAVLLWRIMRVSINAQDLFGSLVATGIAVMIGSQAIINVAVVTNTIPNTGVPLPFISYGGTSLAIMMASVGIVLSISRYTKD